MNCKDKVVVITGASSGIGEACALAFAKEGASLVLAARRIDRLKSMQSRVRVPCIIQRTDMRIPTDIHELMEQALSAFGRIDILVNNAGIGGKGPTIDLDDACIDAVIETNLSAVMRASRDALRIMSKQHSGHIITIASMAGIVTLPRFGLYCASKHGVCSFMRALKYECAPINVKTNTVHPGRVRTPFFTNYDEQPCAREMLDASDIAEYVVAIAKRDVFLRVAIATRNFIKRAMRVLGA